MHRQPDTWLHGHLLYDPVTVHPNIAADFPGDTMLLEPVAAEHRRVWPRIRRHCRHYGNDDERTLHIWQAVWEHRHPASVGLPLWHVGAGDREVHQAGPGDQRAQEGAPAVPHPEGHHKGQPRSGGGGGGFRCYFHPFILIAFHF